MRLLNRISMENRLNEMVILEITDDDFNRLEGELLLYTDRNADDYEYMITWLDENKELNETVCTYMKENVEMYKRVDIPEYFNLDGFDIRSFRIIKDEIDGENVNEHRYVKFMNDVFGFDFSYTSVELYFLTDNDGYVVTEKLLLHSSFEHVLWKNYVVEWFDCGDTLIIGMYGYGMLIVVRDEKVYACDEYDLADPDTWNYVCDVLEIKIELNRIKTINVELDR